MNKFKKLISIALIAAMLSGVFLCSAGVSFAQTNGGYLSGVRPEMNSADYWKSAGSSALLYTKDEIAEFNALVVANGSDTRIKDLSVFTPARSADDTRKALASYKAPSHAWYVDGKELDSEPYYKKINDAILSTGYKGQTAIVKYAVATSVADVKDLPTDDILCDSLTDTADENQTSALVVNEPFIVCQKCEYDGKTFYWGYSENVTGWINAQQLAICEDKDAWLDLWKAEESDEVLVVTCDKVVLERSMQQDYPSYLQLTLGTVLKLVPESDLQAANYRVAERGTLNNYVVYLPTRAADGSCVKIMALISEHSDVSVGFLPYTEENVLNLAFKCLGNRYGWGNMFMDLDCSGYLRNIFRCFGIIMPRNTTWQRLIPGTLLNFKGLTDAQKTEVLKNIPAGTPLYMPGHAMMYLGDKSGEPCVISSTAMFSDASGDVNVQKYLGVLVTPMSVRKANGNTWLASLENAVMLRDWKSIEACQITAERKATQTDAQAAVVVKDGNKTLKKGRDYTLMFDKAGYAVAVGTGEYVGAASCKINIIIPFTDVSKNAAYYDAVTWAFNEDITTGTDQTHFSPNALCTRAQVLTFLWKAAGKPEASEAAASSFTDVPAGAYYEKAVLWAVEKGITTGTSESTFSPNRIITTAQFEAFGSRYFGREISIGSSDEFVTRAQAVSVLYTYAKSR